MFFVLIHDYTLCFNGSPYCIFSYWKFSYYNYISIWPYYIVIHFTGINITRLSLSQLTNRLWEHRSLSWLFYLSENIHNYIGFHALSITNAIYQFSPGLTWFLHYCQFISCQGATLFCFSRIYCWCGNPVGYSNYLFGINYFVLDKYKFRIHNNRVVCYIFGEIGILTRSLLITSRLRHVDRPKFINSCNNHSL